MSRESGPSPEDVSKKFALSSIESKEKMALLTEREAQDLATLWQQLGSGEKIKPEIDPEKMRESLWKSAKLAYREHIIPKMDFERNQDLENRLKNEHRLVQRAELEHKLLLEYVPKIHNWIFKKETHGWGTTPALAKQLDYRQNCVGNSASFGIILEDLGMRVNAGQYSGHTFLVVRDALNKPWIVDVSSGGTVGPINDLPVYEEGQMQIYRVSPQERKKLKMSRRWLIERPLADGFLASAIGNIDGLRTRYRGLPDQTTVQSLYKNNRKTLELQNWDRVLQKMFPGIAKLRLEFGSLSRKDKQLVNFEEKRWNNLAKQVVRSTGHDYTWYRQLLIRSQEDREAILEYLSSKSSLSKNGPAEDRIFWQKMRQSIARLSPQKQEFALDILERRLHTGPKEIP